jgi:hypothetical protein
MTRFERWRCSAARSKTVTTMTTSRPPPFVRRLTWRFSSAPCDGSVRRDSEDMPSRCDGDGSSSIDYKGLSFTGHRQSRLDSRPLHTHHKACDEPPPDEVLWRYMDLTRFLALLDSRSLFFCQASRLEDPFEGSLSEATVREREKVREQNPLDEAFIVAPYERMPALTAINCWSANAHESVAMWRLYCPSGPGVAVRSTFGALTASFAEARHKILVSRVAYVDYEHARIPDGHLLAPFLHKRGSFEHEREVRAVIQHMPDQTMPNRPSPFDQNGGVNVPVGLDVLLKRVYVSPTAPAWYSDLVKRVVGKYQVAAEVHQSNLDADPIY